MPSLAPAPDNDGLDYTYQVKQQTDDVATDLADVVAGLGTMSSQDANAVNITGGTVDGTDITGGTIDGSAVTGGSLDGCPVGDTTPAAITATTGDFSDIVTTAKGRIHALRVVTAAGDITATTDDEYIIVNKASGAATVVNLPASPPSGLLLNIKDGKGDAVTNNITLTPAAGTIDGAATLVISTAYGRASVIYNGTEWSVV